MTPVTTSSLPSGCFVISRLRSRSQGGELGLDICSFKFLKFFFSLLNKKNVDKEFREIITQIASVFFMVEKYHKAPYYTQLVLKRLGCAIENLCMLILAPDSACRVFLSTSTADRHPAHTCPGMTVASLPHPSPWS